MKGALAMRTNHPNIRAVAFDFGGVLAYFIDKHSIAEMAGVAGVGYEPFNTSMWKFREGLDSGEYDNLYYWTLVLDDCNSTVSRKGLVETLVEMDVQGFSRMNQKLLAWAKTLKKQGFGTLIISNMAETTYQSLIANQPWLGHFDAVVISGIIGINKPDQRIFTHAVERMHLDAAEILFLDDLSHNVASAKEGGLHALVYSDTTQLAQDLTAHFPILPVDELL
jgi:putative hydrolase of the HAD superfamily